MLASDQVAAQLPAVVAGLQERLDRMGPVLAQAAGYLGDWAANPDVVDERILNAMAGNSRPFALSLEAELDSSHSAPDFSACTVIAADGSSIPVDRYAPVPCYVINTGAVALSYGVDGDPTLEARARVGPAEGGSDPDVSAGGLDLLRDVIELEAVVELAITRSPLGPVAALLDGTLLPWDLDSPLIDPLARTALQSRTASALAAIRGLSGAVALGAYVSASRSSEVSTSLSCLAGESAWWPLTDSMVFGRILQDGERSSLFRARSERVRRVEDLFSDHDQVCFFYLRVGPEMARVEVPVWAASEQLVDILHSALVDQCRRGSGYPRALQEAHEQAVINGHDRELFSRLLERVSSQAGLRTDLVGKAASKRRRLV